MLLCSFKFTMPTYTNCPDLDVDLSGHGGTADEAQTKRTRIRAGSLKKMGRLLLFSGKKPATDPDHFSHVALSELAEVPVDVQPDRKMNFGQRYQERVIRYRRGALRTWDSCVFGRAEEGKRIVTGLLRCSYNAFCPV